MQDSYQISHQGFWNLAGVAPLDRAIWAQDPSGEKENRVNQEHR